MTTMNIRPPLLSDDDVTSRANSYTYPYSAEVRRAVEWTRDRYEAARAKDAELIQQLVDAVDVLDAYTSTLDTVKEKALAAAAQMNFKPTDNQ